MIKVLLKKYWPVLLGVALGAVAGYLYWRYVGCTTGSCPITSSPIKKFFVGSCDGRIIGKYHTTAFASRKQSIKQK